MKKIFISVLIIVCLVGNFCTVNAEEKVDGLREKISELFMANAFTEEEMAEIERNFWQWYDKKWESELEGLNYLHKRAYPDSDEQEYEYWKKFHTRNFTKGIKITALSNTFYSSVYAQNNCLRYLFSDFQFWAVPNKWTYSHEGHFPFELILKERYSKGSNGDFNLDGTKIAPGTTTSDEDYKLYRNTDLIFWNDETMEYLIDGKELERLLLEKGETKVDEVHLIKYYGFNLYIRCGENEYILMLTPVLPTTPEEKAEFSEIFSRSQKGENLIFKLYTVEEIANYIEICRKESSTKYSTPEKPVYETEALALQSDGLLYGNERGLDLLKPLTRIEAAAILLRAMGINVNETQAQVQTFSDVEASHWGYSVAETAYDIGLIQGVGENMFAPDKRVSATEFGTMVLRAANTGEFNWEEAVDILVSKGVLTEENTKYMDFFTRGDMAKIIYEARAHGLF